MSADEQIAPEIGKAAFLGCLAVLFAVAVVSAIAVAVYRAFAH
jgi:hypothetical protein